MALTGSLSSFYNKIKETAETTTKAHIETIVLKQFKTHVAHAKHIKEMFKYSLNHECNPFLWRYWEVTDVPTSYQKPITGAMAVKAKKTWWIMVGSLGASKLEYCVVTIPKINVRVLQKLTTEPLQRLFSHDPWAIQRDRVP